MIGRDNGLPWRLKSDMQHFRALTMGKPVVMGRKTFLSIGKPLPGRTNIVVTRDRAFRRAGRRGRAAAWTRRSTPPAATRCARGVDAIMVTGGADIFAQAMPLADRLEITHVHVRPAGDAYFPAIDRGVWHEIARSEHAAGPQDDAASVASRTSVFDVATRKAAGQPLL